MVNFATRSPKHIGSGNHLVFSTLQLSNTIVDFLPPNVTSVVQPLDQGIIASFKVQYKKWKWVFSLFGFSTTHQDLRRIVPNAWHVIMWCS